MFFLANVVFLGQQYIHLQSHRQLLTSSAFISHYTKEVLELVLAVTYSWSQSVKNSQQQVVM